MGPINWIMDVLYYLNGCFWNKVGAISTAEFKSASVIAGAKGSDQLPRRDGRRT